MTTDSLRVDINNCLDTIRLSNACLAVLVQLNPKLGLCHPSPTLLTATRPPPRGSSPLWPSRRGTRTAPCLSPAGTGGAAGGDWYDIWWDIPLSVGLPCSVVTINHNILPPPPLPATRTRDSPRTPADQCLLGYSTLPTEHHRLIITPREK